MTIKVRSARVEDAAAMALLLTQLGYPSEPCALRAELLRLQQWPAVRVLLAVSGEQAVAMMQLLQIPALAEPAYVEVRSLVVDAGWRGRGIGAQLLAEAQCWARQVATGRVRVRCNRVREAAHRFYRQQGYRELKSQTLFEKTTAD